MTTMLTTVDNPYDPFDQWDDWFAWDEASGYHTSGLLDRIVELSDDTSEADQEVALNNAIDEIVMFNVSGMHTKVVRAD